MTDLTSRAYARSLDEKDPLAPFRDEFLVPKQKNGEDVVYFCGNSLGLQPKAAKAALDTELESWAELGVEGHFEGPNPWYSYHERFSAPLASVVGAKPHEIAAMNGLTVNLHLMMVSFYRPTPKRFQIVIEKGAFPSDRYAVASQAHAHGFDPKDAIVELGPREGERALRTEDVEAWLAENGHRVALVMLSGVNYYTGQVFDMERITAAGHKAGARVGWDLAHAAGNVDLKLHDWGPDFACWCSYKYMNSGPGAVSGVFVHERHRNAPDLPRFAGWWGTDPKTRFEMKEFVLQDGAGGWQMSNAPIFNMAIHAASLEQFSRAGMPALRAKSLALSGYLFDLLDALEDPRIELLTPRDDKARGCQISVHVPGEARAIHDALTAGGVVCDYREPDVIRLAPVPLYNSFEDVWRFYDIFKTVLKG